MRKHLIPLAALIAATPLLGQDKPVPSPPEIVNAAPKADWAAIAPSDLMVMDLAPDAKGKPRRVVIQLMPAPFSQGWVSNIRKLAAARFWDGLSINRVQDNYVVQWGDATEKKPLPEDLAVVPEADYTLGRSSVDIHMSDGSSIADRVPYFSAIGSGTERPRSRIEGYPYSTGFLGGWPFAGDVQATAQTEDATYWPVHCYGMVGVGRDMPPNTGTGAELYTVIGHAPRHLDRNIALVGRVIEGIEHMSSLPRGTGALGFYETAEERTGIVSVRIGSAVSGLPAYEYLSTESESFARYADARANRRDAFFIRPAGGADVCNIPVPVRQVK
jgi:peptidylprolyl isomerase